MDQVGAGLHFRLRARAFVVYSNTSSTGLPDPDGLDRFAFVAARGPPALGPKTVTPASRLARRPKVRGA